MPTLTFRSALPSDAHGIAAALDAFGPASIGSDRYNQRCDHIRHTASRWRIGLQDGRVVCAAYASPSAVWFGSSPIGWTDVGEVCVSPAIQGGGIGSLIMADIVKHLHDTQCPISRLGGLVRFYSRFGYERFPRNYIEFPVQPEIHAGASTQSFLDTLKPTLRAVAANGIIRPFDPAKDHPALWDIMEKFNRHRTGARVFNRPASSEGMNHILVYEQSNQPAGMMVLRLLPQDHTPSEAMATIYEIAYDPQNPAALESLLKHALRAAFNHKASRATAYLPADTALLNDLESAAIDYNLCQTRGTIASNMVQITNLHALLIAITPELTLRTTSIPYTGNITIDLGNQQSTLRLTPGNIQITSTGTTPSDLTLKMTHAQLLSTLLGVPPITWPNQVPPHHPAASTLMAMFPPTPGAYNS